MMRHSYHILGVPISVSVLFCVFGLLVSPMIATLAMSFSSVSVKQMLKD